MATIRAGERVPLDSARESTHAAWLALGRRQRAELAAPGAVIGLAAGAIGGGLAAMAGLSPPAMVVAALALGVPLGLGGAAYELLLASGKLPVAALWPAVLVWMVAFPLARVIHEIAVDLAMGVPIAVPDGWAGFVAFQAMVSVGFAIGFWWLHENFAPRWWYHVRNRNPVADEVVRVKLKYAYAAEYEKERRAQVKQQRRRR